MAIQTILGRSQVHPFPARMAPDIVLSALAKEEGSLRVLDPMTGSGTVPAVARAGGHRAFGFDLDPLAVLISRVWTQPLDHKKFIKRGRDVLARAIRTAKDMHGRDAYPMRANEEEKRFVRYWFDLEARKQLAALAKHISRVREDGVRRALWCAFSRLIITKSAGASRAADLSHSRPHLVYDAGPRLPFDYFLSACASVKRGSASIWTKEKGPRTVIKEGDARSLPVVSESIDLVVTSPPYMNAIDYLRCSKFSLVWMGLSLGRLRTLRSGSVGTEVSLAESLTSVFIEEACSSSCDGLLPRRQRLILARYGHDMASVLSEVKRVLIPGGKAVLVVGNSTVRGVYIRNSDIVRKLALHHGFEVVSTEERELPANRRYLPPPTSGGTSLARRMRTEVVATLHKPPCTWRS